MTASVLPRGHFLKLGFSDPDHDGDDDSTPQGDTDHDWWTASGQPLRSQAASGLPQIQQVTDPNNAPDPQGDQLPAGVMFPLNDAFGAQWETSPEGARPRGGEQIQAEAYAALPPNAARLLGQSDAMAGRNPQHKESFGHSKIQHGRYLGGFNETAGLIHGLVGRAAMSAAEYANLTGRGDLHADYLASYARGRQMHANSGQLYRADDEGQVTAFRRTADAWSQPRATTDDVNAPYSSPTTTPDPRSQNASPESADYSAGKSAGAADRARGDRPAFADNSSGVSPYVKGYAEGFGGNAPPAGPQDVPASMGGDSGQAMNAQEAQRSFEVARAPRTARLRVSASFAPPTLHDDPEFRKGYLFAAKWRPGQKLAGVGSARFEAGLYAGMTDSPASQRAWSAAHRRMAKRHPELARRMRLHASFTRKHQPRTQFGRLGAYLRVRAGTTTDLVTDGPGTSPDPMGSTPLNGPGAPPPMAGLSDPAASGGAPPYQGAAPLPGGPVVPDDVMGRPQQKPQTSGPFTNTFSGAHPENADLAPVAPNNADRRGYSNREAYEGDPHGNDRLAAFRVRVREGMRKMGSSIVYDTDPDTGDWREGHPREDRSRMGEPGNGYDPWRDAREAHPNVNEHIPADWEIQRGYDIHGRAL
jgi:hypothetical protein